MALKSGKKKPGSNGLLAWFINLFISSSPERKKRYLLKQVEKKINSSRHKLYRPRNRAALPGMGKLFFEIHRVTSNTFALLSSAKSSEGLKWICVESFMTEQQRAMLSILDEETIRETMKSQDPKTYATKLEKTLDAFMGSFDNATVAVIENSYAQILHFLEFISYDYAFLVKKFSPNFSGSTVPAPPRFENVYGDYINNDLKDILESVLVIDFKVPWNKLFDILSEYKNMEIINRRAWARVAHTLKGVVGSGVMTMIIQHLGDDPYWKPSLVLRRTSITSTYLNKVKARIKKLLLEVKTEKRSAELERLCGEVFGSYPVPRMQHYNKMVNSMFDSRLKSKFEHVEAMNFLRAYCVDFFHKEAQEITELFLVRGKWVTSDTSKQISEPYYRFLEVSEQVIKFDESLSETGERGSKLKNALAKVVVGDPLTFSAVQSIVQAVNKNALSIIGDAVRKIVVYGNGLKSLMLDINDAPDHTLIVNWNELISICEIPLKARMATEYKRIYHFVQLMQNYVKK